jgi:hypothetical protein
MAILAVVRLGSDELVSTIVAEMTDPCPEGCYFVELPPDHTWIKGKIISYNELNSGHKELQVF